MAKDRNDHKEVRIEEILLKGADTARKTCNGFVADDDEGMTGGRIKQVLTDRHGHLLMLDRDWAVESDFFHSVVGDVGEENMKARILDCMPTAGLEKSIPDCLDELTKLGDSMLFTFVGAGMKSTFRYVHGVMKALSSGHMPNLGAETVSSDFLSKVKERLTNFVRFNKPASSSEAAVTIVGKPAMKHRFDEAAAQVQGGKVMTLADLRVFHLFGWMLEPADQTKVQQWTSKVCAPLVSSEPKARAKPSAKRQAKVDAAAAVAEYLKA